MPVDTNYQYTPTELTELGQTGSSAAYNTRIAAYNASKGSGTITSGNLGPTAPISPVTPDSTKVPDISNLATDYTPITETPQESQASDLTKSLQDINTSLTGKSAYQAQQNEAAGVNHIQQAINDNATALKQLQNESASAKLQQEDRQAPTFAIAGAQGAIDRATAVKALTLSSISDVLNNNLV